MMKKFFLFLIWPLLFAGEWAEACSDMGFYLTQPAPYFQTGGSMKETFGIVVNGNTTQGACNYFLTFDYGSSTSYTTRSMKFGSNTWPYQVSKDTAGMQILKKFPEGASCSDFICDKLQGNSSYNTQSQSYTISIDTTNDWRAAGTYVDTLTVRLYRGPVNNATLVTSHTQTLTFGSHRKADISVVSSGGSFDINKTTHTMNFANGLITGAKGTADIILKYNAGYSLYAWTDNGGKLKKVGGTDTIDYTFKINGNVIAIPWWTLIASGSGASPASGLVNPVEITIGNTTGKSQGAYQDTINLTIQSNQ